MSQSDQNSDLNRVELIGSFNRRIAYFEAKPATGEKSAWPAKLKFSMKCGRPEGEHADTVTVEVIGELADSMKDVAANVRIRLVGRIANTKVKDNWETVVQVDPATDAAHGAEPME